MCLVVSICIDNRIIILCQVLSCVSSGIISVSSGVSRINLSLSVQGKVDEMNREREQMNLQMAEMSILARIKQDEGEADITQQEGETECV